MIESILDNEDAVKGALLRIGQRELTISAIERNMLLDLRAFLQPFRNLTNMVSGKLPHLGLVYLIKHEIKQVCQPCTGDLSTIKELKRLVLRKLEARMPESETTQLAVLLDPATKDVVDLTHDQKVSQ
jgi:hypothetical protein